MRESVLLHPPSLRQVRLAWQMLRELVAGQRASLQGMTGGRHAIRAAGLSGPSCGNRNPKVYSKGREGPNRGHSLSPHPLFKNKERRKWPLKHELENFLKIGLRLTINRISKNSVLISLKSRTLAALPSTKPMPGSSEATARLWIRSRER